MTKKLIAMLAAVMIAATMVSCGGDDSSSKKDNSKASDSQAAEGSSDNSDTSASEGGNDDSKSDESKTEDSKPDESKPDESKSDDSKAQNNYPADYKADIGELTKNFSEDLQNKAYEMDFKIIAKSATASGSMATDTKNIKVKAYISGLNIDAYVIGGKVYMLVPDAKAYMVYEDGYDLNKVGVNDYSLDKRAVYFGTEEKDGMICEKYGVPASKSAGADFEFNAERDSTNTYCFDKDTKKPLKLLISSPITGDAEIQFTKMEFNTPEIKMPDITGWTELKQGEQLDSVTQLRLTMSTLGITEDMLKKSGYTFDQIAAMSTKESTEALAKVMRDNGLK